MCKKPLCIKGLPFRLRSLRTFHVFGHFFVNVIPEEIDGMMTFVESIAQYIFARGW